MVQKNQQSVKILESFRDGIQGLPGFVPTPVKIELINALLKVGFDIVDIGSFVSGRHIPQFDDMQEVLEQVKVWNSDSKVFVLVANVKGADKAVQFEKIDILGYPFSISPVFLHKNINRTLDESFEDIKKIQDLCFQKGKQFMVYNAMAFGNPYGDPQNLDIIMDWTIKMDRINIKQISFSDIIGVATPEQIAHTYQYLTIDFPEIEFGIHLHTQSDDWYEKTEAAYNNGCKIFDGVLSGLGGCPMTGYELLGNLNTSHLIEFFNKNKVSLNLKMELFEYVKQLTAQRI
ncbi:MAG: hypothetical protein K9H49_01515 [Bacteroidales bacterium]|nr:hypothetical protein [Bacteroidales bacterium]MCF8403877.1 hypothetical protein [Bacteroidales bacterium]